MGSLSCFPRDGAKETPSPLKVDSSSIKVGIGKELGGMGILQESGMAGNGVEVYERLTKEVQMNKQRMQRNVSRENRHSAENTQELSDAFSKIANSFLPQVEPIPSPADAPKRFGKTNVAKNEEMDRKLLHRDGDRRRGEKRLPSNGTGTGGLQIDIYLTNTVRQAPTSLTAPDSRMGFEPNSDEEWEVNVKLVKRYRSPPPCALNDPDIFRQVYFYQEIPYWTGRFSTLCDRLKIADGRLVSSTDGSTLFSPSHPERAGTGEPFEIAESRRTEYVLKELRSYCRTNAALRSFEDFETQIRCHPERRGEAHRELTQGSVIRSAEEVIRGFKHKPDSKPKFGWHFGQSQVSKITNKALATGSAIASKQRPVMIKSKTTSNLAGILDRGATMTMPETNCSRTGNAKSLPGSTWQRPTVQEAQAQTQRVREERVFAKAETYRKASGQESGVGKAWTNKIAASPGGGVDRRWAGPNGPATNGEESVGTGVAQGWQGNEPPSVGGKPAAKDGHSRKSRGSESLSLKKVLSDSMKGMRKVRRSIPGSGLVSGNDRIID
jgi:hypothetical protein